MLVSIITLFPEMFTSPFSSSILKRAQDKNLLQIKLTNLRDFSLDRYKSVDDRPYGGGKGMILRVDVIDRAIQSVLTQRGPTSSRKRRIVLLDPQGKAFNQKAAKRLSKVDHLILICGHYEGVDERVRNLVDEEISIGDYVLTGGEVPAMVLIDAVTRLIPKVLKKKESVELESFSKSSLEYPQYTRPPIYKPQNNKIKTSAKWRIPQILLSGDHKKIEKWRREKALKRTRKRRPDLLLT